MLDEGNNPRIEVAGLFAASYAELQSQAVERVASIDDTFLNHSATLQSAPFARWSGVVWTWAYGPEDWYPNDNIVVRMDAGGAS